MKKLIALCKCSNLCSSYGGGSRVIKVLASPTRTLTSSAPSTYTASTGLYSRLLPIVNPSVPIVAILDQWVEQGKRIDPDSLCAIVDRFRKSKCHNHCLQIVQWMSDKKVVDPSPYHVSAQLDLISKVHGVGPAEAFFDSVPDTLRVWDVYNALLNGYAKAKLLDKAEATMEKMKELGYARSSSYNMMLTLYYQLGNHEKLDLLLQEMEEKGINCDKYTYNIRLSAYGASSDVEHIETLLMKMETDPFVTMDWNAYTSAAIACLKAGATEKAFETLKKSEHLIIGDKTSAYEVMMRLYARMGERDEVYRIWNLNKKIGTFKNTTYFSMIISLGRLDDLDGAEKILQEWEAGLTHFDCRLPNFLITAYCKKGLMEKAELAMKRLKETGREPNGSTWSHIAFGFVKDNQMDKAVEALKKEILVSNEPHAPNIMTLVPCLKYLNRKGDTDAAEEIIKSLQEKGLFLGKGYQRLVKRIEKENQGSNASS